MTRTHGGTKVDGGYYLNLRTWAFEAVNGDSGVLPGDDDFIHLPALAVLPAALVLSFVFVVFLPFIGFAMLAYALARKAASLTGGASRGLAATMAPSWKPGMAFFAGEAKHEGEAKDAPAPGSEKLEALEKDIAARREEEKQG